ncbi:MAG: glycosyltransferase family 2 protein [Microbacteriaceae bacterium]|nr:glycosyltransferase family 2 protein [Microbacteriaceae bacterium]
MATPDELVKRVVGGGLRRVERLPRPLKGAVHRASYSLNTRGLEENPEWRRWTAANARPVTIVIPSYNDVELLSHCLASIERTASHLDYHVIVVDDYAQEANRERLRALESERVSLILKPEREGFAIAVNTGMRAVPADRDIVVLNSDIVTLPGWLDALMGSAYAIDPKIGMVSGRLVYPHGRIQYGGTYYARVLAPQWFGHLFVNRSPRDPVTRVAGYNRSISGACTYVTRAAYDRVGGLHEDYWLGFEDVDWGLTAWQAGVRCYYQPDAMAIHHESASRGYSQGPRELASMRLFWRRWEPQFLTRELAAPFEVDFVVSDRADVVQRRHVDVLAERLRGAGTGARVHEVAADAVDETLVAELEGRESVKVCCDSGAQTTTWLASLEHGKPVYLLPGVERAQFGRRAPERAPVIAGYRPEYDYIAPDRHTARTVSRLSAWEVQHRVVPVLAPAVAVVEAAADAPIVVLGGRDEEVARVASLAEKHGRTLVRLGDPRHSVAALDALASAAPVAVVSFLADVTSAVPLLAMSRGAVFLGPVSDQTKFEVLDGYNALTFDTATGPAVALESVLADPQVAAELAANGRSTAERLYDRGLADLVAALTQTARTAV